MMACAPGQISASGENNIRDLAWLQIDSFGRAHTTDYVSLKSQARVSHRQDMANGSSSLEKAHFFTFEQWSPYRFTVHPGPSGLL